MRKKLLTIENLKKKINEAKDNKRMYVLYHSVFPKEFYDENPDAVLLDENDSIMVSKDGKTMITNEDCPLEVYKGMLEAISKEDEYKVINKLVPYAFVDLLNNISYEASDTEKYF